MLAPEAITALCELERRDKALVIRLLYTAKQKDQVAIKALMKDATRPLPPSMSSEEPEPLSSDHLDLLTANPDAWVLVVEHDRAVTAAARMRDYICVPCSVDRDGRNLLRDMRPLVGRMVVLWPTNSDAGFALMERVARDLLRDGRQAQSITYVVDLDGIAESVQSDLPDGWSLADAPDAWTDLIARELTAQRESTMPRNYSRRRDGLYVLRGETYRRISGPVRVVALTRDRRKEGWGKLLSWRDSEGGRHRLAISSELLVGGGEDLRKLLAQGGLHIGVGKEDREALAHFINECDPKRYVLCVAQPGWHGDRYVQRDAQGTVFGDGDLVVPQGPLFSDPMVAKGTLEEWQREVGALCVGNNSMTFSVSVSFAAPCIRDAGVDGGGFHLKGDSSSGKTRCQRCASSVWGFEPASWRTSDNGLEGLCAASNDSLLCLDELKQLNPLFVPDATYLIANGQSKKRMRANTELRESRRWLTLLLSSGEVTLEAHAGCVGLKLDAGVEARIVTVTADPQARYGFFSAVHGADGADDKAKGYAFAQRILSATERYTGTAGPAFMRAMLADLPAARNRIRAGVQAFIDRVVPPQADGQVLRVAARFGVVAAAGELAIAYGIVPWPIGAAQTAAEACFVSWLETRPGGTKAAEDARGVAQVRLWLINNCNARFEKFRSEPNDKSRISNRAGWWRYGPNQSREYIIPREVWESEVCRGLDPRRVARCCVSAGILLPDGDDKPSQNQRLPGEKKPRRVYICRLPDERGEESG